jgi:hypothetical protein
MIYHSLQSYAAFVAFQALNPRSEPSKQPNSQDFLPRGSPSRKFPAEDTHAWDRRKGQTWWLIGAQQHAPSHENAVVHVLPWRTHTPTADADADDTLRAA